MRPKIGHVICTYWNWRWSQSSGEIKTHSMMTILLFVTTRGPWKTPSKLLFGRGSGHHGLLILFFVLIRLKGAGLRTLPATPSSTVTPSPLFLHWLRRKSRSFGAAPPPSPSAVSLESKLHIIILLQKITIFFFTSFLAPASYGILLTSSVAEPASRGVCLAIVVLSISVGFGPSS